MPWSQGFILKGAGVIVGHGVPSNSNPATANAFKGQSYLDEDTGRLYPNFDGAAWTTSPIALRGRSFFPVTQPPDQTVGIQDDSVFDLSDNMRIYGPKQADGSFPKTNLFLQGTAGSDANLPVDITGNSIVLSPKSGTQQPAQIELINSGNSPVFVVDDDGNAMIAGAVNITGVTTANTLNAGSLTAASLTSTGNASFQQAVQISGATTAAALQAQSLDVKGPSTFEGDTVTAGIAQASSVTTGTLTAGTAHLTSLTADRKLIADEIDVQRVIVGSGTTAGSVQVYGPTQLYDTLKAVDATLTGNVSAQKLSASADSTFAANLSVAQALNANAVSIAARNVSGNVLSVANAAGDSTVFSVDANGNVALAGTLTVAGAETNASLNAGALTATSFVDSGNAQIKGALEVDGDSSVQKLTAANASVQALSVNAGLTVIGAAQLADLSAKAAHVASLLSDGNAEIDGTLLVKGASTLAALSAGATQLGATSASSMTLSGGLTAQGPTALKDVTTGALQAHSLGVDTDVNLSGNVFASGPVFTNTLSITSSDSTPFSVHGPSQQLLSLDSAGDLVVAGALTVQGTGASGATNAGALTVSSLKDTGAAQISGALSVGGDTTLAKTTTGALTSDSVAALGDSSIAGKLSVSSNLTVNGSAVIGSIGTGGINSTGITIARDTAGNLGNLSVQDRIFGDRLQVNSATLGTLLATSPVTLQSTLTTNGAAQFKDAVSVQGQTTLGAARTGALTADSLTTNGALSVAGNASVTGSLASGAVTAPAVTVQLPSSGAATYPLQVLDASGNKLLTCDGAGDFAVAGTLTVAGAQTNTATNAGALQATSFVDSGNATVQGNLTVQGSTTLAGASASSLSVSGSTTLAATSTGDISASKVTTTGPIVSGGALTAYGNSTLAATSTQALSATSVNASGAVQVGTTLNVTGASTLANLTAAALTASSASVTGNASVGGTLNATGATTLGSSLGVSGAVTMASTLNVSGQTQAAAMAVKLPSSGASSTPLTVAKADNTSLLSLDGSGNLTIPGNISSGNYSTSSSTTGALTASSISDTGTLSVQGNSTLAALSASSSAISGNETVGGTLKVTGATTLAALNASSVANSGNETVGGTLAVSGATTLAAAQVSSLNDTGNASVGGTLSVTGASTLAALSAGAITCTGVTNSGSTSVAGTLSAAAVAITLPSSNAATNPILLKSNGGTTLLAVDQSGNITASNVTAANLSASATFSATGAATFGSTVSITGATTAAAITSSGLVTAKNMTLTSGGGGVLTFADGSTQSTSATAGTTVAPFISGNGPPTSTTAPSVIKGQSYWDTQNNFVYPVSTTNDYTGFTSGPFNVNGQTGPQGYTTMPSGTMVPGPNLQANSTTFSSTPYVLNIPNTSMPQVYTAPSNSALMGFGVGVNSSAITVELYDRTAGTSIMTQSCSANTSNWYGPFASNKYPMIAGNEHVWRVTGSASATVQISPSYLNPSTLAAPAVCPVTGYLTASGSSFSSTATATYNGGVAAGQSKNVFFFRQASLYRVIVTYAPSGSTASTATVQALVKSYYNGADAGAIYTTGNAAATGKPIVFGPFTPGTYVWPASYANYVTIVGNGTGQVNVDLDIVY